METPFSLSLFFFSFDFNHCQIKVQCLTEKRSILPSLGAKATAYYIILSPSSGFPIKLQYYKEFKAIVRWL